MVGTDCASLVCTGGTCLAPKCNDQVKNGSETDVDCGGGGMCPACPDKGSCVVATDCQSGVCSGMMCVSAMCADGVKNGTETAVDCGGGACAGCAPGQPCGAAVDCESGVCATTCVDYRVWGKRFGDAVYQSGDRVAVDGAANVVVQGSFLGTVNPGGNVLTDTCVSDPMDPLGACIPDWFVAQFKTDGTFKWAKHIVNQSDGFASNGLTFTGDPSGNVYILARGDGKFDLGGGVLSPPGVCPPTCGSASTVIAKLDSTGAYKWGKRFGDASGGDLAGFDIATDTSGNTVTTGLLAGSVSFGGTTLTSNGQDAFAVKLDSNGGHVWSKRFGDATTLEQCGESVAVDGAANVILAGYFKSSISLGGPTLTTAGGFDIFLTKLSPLGAHVWSKRFGDVQNQASSCSAPPNSLTVTADPAGNTILAGKLVGSVDFGGAPLISTGADAFVAKFNLTGAHLWSKRFGGVTLGRVAADAGSAVLLTGSSTGTVDFGGGSLPGMGGFVAKLAADGSHIWSHRLAGIGGSSIAAGPSPHVFLTGALNGTEDFGGTPLVSAGGPDAFVAKILTP
jgi:hypothetical protein